MSQTTLNLVAITIFSLVMVSLLGPLLHISPVVPAVAAFSILSIATLDSFSLQGRLGTLVVDTIAQFSPEHRSRIVRHEAGHFLAAHLLGIPVTGYTLNAWEALRQGQPGQGGVSFGTAELEAQIATGQISTQMVDRYCTVWMSGIAAEQLEYGNAEGGANDRETIRLLWMMQLKRSLGEADLKQRWALLQAKTLLQDHKEAYAALVEAMEQRQPVEVCQETIQASLKSANLAGQS
ncbi:ATP-dependent Zn protease [Leptolyngbya ohadii]|uniref:ATP-dependent Zn protease n=1 Tax=Leptolyngbya ohadii TaxID=1962290 RepID=UPI000B59B110|nr:ATP-dependent Zn protease [Leptolyngbya ohadii]